MSNALGPCVLIFRLPQIFSDCCDCDCSYELPIADTVDELHYELNDDDED